ncbi:DUF1952 domain-containing protein [Oceanithermus sp.]
MTVDLRDLRQQKRLLRELPPGRRVFLRSSGLAIEVGREEAERWLDERIAAAERALRDALEKIRAAYRALAEADEARFRALAAELALIAGFVPADRYALEALEKEIEAQLEEA